MGFGAANLEEPQVPQQGDLGMLASTVGVITGREFPSGGDEEVVPGDNELCEVIEDLWRRSRDTRYWARRAEMELNRAFFHNRAYAIFDIGSHTLDLDPPSSNPNAKRLQLNLFTSFVLTAAARISATHPVILVHAGTQDQKDIDNAQLAQRGLDYEWNRQGMPRLIARSVLPLHLDGTVIWCLEWDPYAGEPEGQEPAYDDQGAEVIDFQTRQPVMVPKYEGQIISRLVDNRHFFLDPTARQAGNMEDALWCMEAIPHSCAWIYRAYGVAVQPDGWQSSDANRSVQHGSITRHETALLRRAWFAPGRYLTATGPMNLPRGLVVTTAGRKVLEKARPNPYDDGRFPYYMVQCIPNDQEPWGETVFNALRSPQVALNKTVSQAVAANDHMADPVWLEPVSAALTDADFWGLAGIRMRYDDSNGNAKPERLMGMGAAQSVFEMIQVLMKAFQTITGQNEGGMAGGSPGSHTSGVGLEVIDSRDSSRLGLTAEEIGRAVWWWGTTTLSRQKQFWKAPRMLSINGQQMEGEIFVFQGSQIGKGFEVRVVADSVIPQSKQSRLSETLVLLQSGIITLQDARRRVARDQVGELTDAQQEINLARNEGTQAEAFGKIFTPVEQMVLEDHKLHLEVHMRDIFKPENQPGPEGVPQAWLALYAHIQLHQQLEWEQAKRQMAVSGTPGTAGPGAPKPGPGGGPASSSGKDAPKDQPSAAPAGLQ